MVNSNTQRDGGYTQGIETSANEVATNKVIGIPSLMQRLHAFAITLIVGFTTLVSHAADPIWKLGAPLLSEDTQMDGKPVRLVDPCIVKHNDTWHIFASANGGTAYVATKDLSKRPIAREVVKLPVGSCFVPQVFFYRPHSHWQLIGMMPDITGRYPKMAPCLCTNADISNPSGWSAPVALDVPPPHDDAQPVKQWIDFWVICDGTKAHLFVTSDAGRLWRSETTLANYPHGWSKAVIALRGDFIYAPHVYRHDVDGKQRYLLTITSRSPDNHHYQQSYTAGKLDAAWTPLATNPDYAFASIANVRLDDRLWRGDLSHGEPVRETNDERMILDPDFTSFIFHGARNSGDGKETKGASAVGLLEKLP